MWGSHSRALQRPGYLKAYDMALLFGTGMQLYRYGLAQTIVHVLHGYSTPECKLDCG